MSKRWITLCIGLAALALLAVATTQASSPAQEPSAQAEALGTEFTYQGQLNLDDQPVDSACDFQFSLYDDELGQTQVGVTQTITGVQVTGGLFTAQIDFGASAFQGDARWLGIQVQCPGDTDYTDLGLQALTTTPYAVYALGAPWSGINDMPAGFADGVDDVGSSGENVIVVAKSGGDYTSVQTALDSIPDAAADNPYLVWIAPGVYSETVTLKPYVHLHGAGQDATVLSSTLGTGWPFITGTLILTANVSVRDLTVENAAAANSGIAILATKGSTQTLVANVTARAKGSGPDQNMGIYLIGDDTHVTLLDVTALAEGGDQNYGLYGSLNAQATLQGGIFLAQGGNIASGISTYSFGGLWACNVLAQGQDGTHNYGLNSIHSRATLQGGSFTARGGSYAWGIYNSDSTAVLDAQGVTALAEGAGENHGLEAAQGAQTTLNGGSFTARGGSIAYGIANYANSTVMTATGVLALGGSGSSENRGLVNYSAQATLYGGSFTGRGGTYAYGLQNRGATAQLDAESVAALAENGSQNTGLYNQEGASALLRGGSFTGRGGNAARGIHTNDDSSYLEAERVSILGEGSGSDRGLESSIGADVLITESVMEGSAVSMVTSGGGGPITASNSRLIGGPATGNVSCTAMSRDTTFNVSGCP